MISVAGRSVASTLARRLRREAGSVLVFVAGEQAKTFQIEIVNDNKSEPLEQLALSLSQPTGAILGGQSWARSFITDNDIAVQQVSRKRKK